MDYKLHFAVFKINGIHQGYVAYFKCNSFNNSLHIIHTYNR
jgi:hypothetical protein